MADHKIKVFVDDDFSLDDIVAKGMLPRSSEVGSHLISLAAESMKNSIAGTVQSIIDAISEVQPTSCAYDVDQVKFTLAFDANGEVGLMSVVKGGLSGKTGIELVLKKTERQG